MRPKIIIFSLLPAGMLWVCLYAPGAVALGECGLSCCLGSSATSGITLAQNFGISAQYEDTRMETLRHGRDEISPDEAISRHWRQGASYSIPTQMDMKKLTLTAAYPVNARLQLLGIAPYLENDMEMRMKNPAGMTMNHTMATVSGWGDVSLMGFYTLYTDAPVRPTQRLTVGLGIKTPTGKNDQKTAKGSYVHAMMQTGTGSWDPLLMINYMQAFYPWIFQANLFYHLSTEGDEGYEFGDQLALDWVTRYQVANYLNVGLDINAIHAGKDRDHEGHYSRAAVSMADNPDYSGLNSIFLSPALQFKIPNSGGSVDLKYQVPIYQNVKGYQQVVDRRLLLSLSWNF